MGTGTSMKTRTNKYIDPRLDTHISTQSMRDSSSTR